MTADNVRRMMRRAGELARLPWPVHPHMLRHSAGYKLANDGHDTRALAHWLGHRTSRTRCGTRSLRWGGSRTSGRTSTAADSRSNARGTSRELAARTGGFALLAAVRGLAHFGFVFQFGAPD
jgi:hypothetical protein